MKPKRISIEFDKNSRSNGGESGKYERHMVFSSWCQGGGGAASAVAATTQNDSLGGIFKHFAPYGRAIRTAAGTDLGVSPFAIAS